MRITRPARLVRSHARRLQAFLLGFAFNRLEIAGLRIHLTNALRLDEHARRIGETLVDARFDVVNRAQDVNRVRFQIEIRIDGDKQLMRPQVHGKHAAAIDHIGVRFHQFDNLARFGLVQTLSHQELLRFCQKNHRHHHKQQRDKHRRDAIEIRILENVAQAHAQQRERKARFGRRVFQYHGIEARILAVANELDGSHVAAGKIELLYRDGKRHALDHHGRKNDHDAQRGIAQLRFRGDVAQIVHTLGKRHTAANREDEHRNHQGPEIQFLAMPEGMVFVAFLLRLVKSE